MIMNHHRDILAGDGTRELPFLVAPITYHGSTVAQRETVNQIYGDGVYQADGQRRYYESHRGKVGNKDLCEHVLSVNGRNASIWFDLSEVSKFSEDPENREVVARDKMRAMCGLPPQHWLGPLRPASRTIAASSVEGVPPNKPKGMKIVWTILKWGGCVLFTVWACSRYGWLGLFAVPAVMWIIKTMKAFDNWQTHWAGTPTPPAPAPASSATSSTIPERKPTLQENLLVLAMQERYRRDMSAAGRTGTEPDADEYSADWLLRTQLGLVPNEPENQPNDSSARLCRRADAAPTKSEPLPQHHRPAYSGGRAVKN